MNRPALRAAVTDQLVLLMALLAGLAALTGPTFDIPGWPVMVVFPTVAAVALAVGIYWLTVTLEREYRERDERNAAEQHARDLEAEQFDRESEILRADNERVSQELRAGNLDAKPSPEAEAIRVKREAEWLARDAASRAERQARIAAYEAGQLKDGAL